MALLSVFITTLLPATVLMTVAPPDLTDILLSLKSILIPIVLIGSAKLIAVAVYWNYKKLNTFTKNGHSFTPKSQIHLDSIDFARQRLQKRLQKQALAQPKTDSANWWAIITNPFVQLWSFIRGLFR